MRQSQIGFGGVDARCLPEIDRMIRAVVAEGKAPFCVYGIYEQGLLVHVNGFGTPETLAMRTMSAPSNEHGTTAPTYVEMDHETSYAHMRLRIASMSKSFTAAAVLRLVWQGRLDLNATVASLLPELAATNAADADAFPITIADLLSMRSGLATDDAWADRQESMSHEEFRQLLGHGLRTVFRPGEGYEYSNIGFAILGEVLSVVTGSELTDYVRSEFLEPLGLRETTYDYRDIDPRMLVCGHHRDASGAWEFDEFTAPGAFSPIGGVISTVHDIARWNAWLGEPFRGSGGTDAALPNGSGLSDDLVLPRRFRRLMQIGHTPMPPIARSGSNRGRLTRRETSESQSYGYGLVLEHDAQYGDIAHHSGGYPGYGSDMRWHLDSGIGLVTLANGRYATPGGVAAQALTMLLDCVKTPDSVAGSSRSRSGTAAAYAAAISSPAVAAKSIRLWPQTVHAMGRVCAMLQALPSFGCDVRACMSALESLSDLFSMNIVMDAPLNQRAGELAAILAQTGALLGPKPSPVAGLLIAGSLGENRRADRMPGLGPVYANNIGSETVDYSAANTSTAHFSTTQAHVGRHSGTRVPPVNQSVSGAQFDLRAITNASALSAQTPAQLSWIMTCERHPLRCSIRLNPLQPPEIESLDFAVADAPKTDDIVTIEPHARIITDVAGASGRNGSEDHIDPLGSGRNTLRNAGKHKHANPGTPGGTQPDPNERNHA